MAHMAMGELWNVYASSELLSTCLPAVMALNYLQTTYVNDSVLQHTGVRASR